MRRLAIVFAMIAAISASEQAFVPHRLAAFAARVVRVPGRIGRAIEDMRRFWRQHVKLLPLAGVN